METLEMMNMEPNMEMKLANLNSDFRFVEDFKKIVEKNQNWVTQNKYIVMVGLVGSGKSTRAEEIKNYLEDMDKKNGIVRDTVILSSDAIREEITGDVNCQTRNDEVFSLLHRRIKDNIGKNNVIFDATNLSTKSRIVAMNCVKKFECFKLCYVMTTPLNICKRQNANRERVVPVEVIDKQVRSFQIPYWEEGWDEIVLDRWPKEVINSLKVGWNIRDDKDILFKIMTGFNQRNSHHVYTLDEHCWRTAVQVGKRYWKNRPMMRAATIHDIGKLYTGELKEDGVNYSYKGHHSYGTYCLLQNIDYLGFNNLNDVLECLFYVNYHMEPFQWTARDKEGKVKKDESGHEFIKVSTEKKLRERFGDYKYDALLWFNYCDKLASGTQREGLKKPRDPFKPRPLEEVKQWEKEANKSNKQRVRENNSLNKKPWKKLSKKQRKKIKKEARLKRKAERRALKASQAEGKKEGN